MPGILKRCATWQVAKRHSLSEGMYTLVPIPLRPWIDVSMDFVLGLPKTRRGKDSVFIDVNRFSKMAHFIACSMINGIVQVVELYFEEVMRHHGVPRSIVSAKDTEFLNHIWITLWKKL